MLQPRRLLGGPQLPPALPPGRRASLLWPGLADLLAGRLVPRPPRRGGTARRRRADRRTGDRPRDLPLPGHLLRGEEAGADRQLNRPAEERPDHELALPHANDRAAFPAKPLGLEGDAAACSLQVAGEGKPRLSLETASSLAAKRRRSLRLTVLPPPSRLR